jgi:hypothetical protein
MRITTRQTWALLKIAEGRFRYVSVSIAKALDKKGLIVFRPTLSKTGRVTRWTATLTGEGAKIRDAARAVSP